MKAKIKVGFLISYDYQYLFQSMKMVYDFVDEIILAIDVDRLTWSGEKFKLPDEFFAMIGALDSLGKVAFFEDRFYLPALSPIENETRERNLLSQLMGDGCWKLQIDVDEYFINFEDVVKFLRQNDYFLYKPQYNAVNLRATWVTLFKKTSNGFLYIDDKEHFSFATNRVAKHYFARDLNAIDNREIKTEFVAVHQSWAREPEEVWQKITNWGHKNDFDTKKYFDFWMDVNEDNYVNFVDLHPFHPKSWPKLQFLDCQTIAEFTEKYRAIHVAKPTLIEKKYYKKYIKNSLKFYLR